MLVNSDVILVHYQQNKLGMLARSQSKLGWLAIKRDVAKWYPDTWTWPSYSKGLFGSCPLTRVFVMRA